MLNFLTIKLKKWDVSCRLACLGLQVAGAEFDRWKARSPYMLQRDAMDQCHAIQNRIHRWIPPCTSPLFFVT